MESEEDVGSPDACGSVEGLRKVRDSTCFSLEE